MTILIAWDDEQLKEVGIDRKRLESLVRRLCKCSKDMQAMGLYIYGASGSGNLVHRSRPPHTDKPNGGSSSDFGSVVAYVGNGFDGGDW